MTLYYRDEAGIVAETVRAGDIEAERGSAYTIDFCGDQVYYTSDEYDNDGARIDKKIPLSALVRIEY